MAPQRLTEETGGDRSAGGTADLPAAPSPAEAGTPPATGPLDSPDLPPAPPAVHLGGGGDDVPARPEAGFDPASPRLAPAPSVRLDGLARRMGPVPVGQAGPASGRRLGAGTVDLDRHPARATIGSPAPAAGAPAASIATGALMLSGSLTAFEGSALSLPPFAHLDGSEDPVEPGADAPEAVLVPAPPRVGPPAPPRLRPSVSSAPLRLPAQPIAITPLFGKARETVTAATVGFDFAPAAVQPQGRRTVSPWLSRPLLDLVSSESGEGENRPSKTRIALVGLAATVLPTIGVLGVANAAANRDVGTASAAGTPEVASVAAAVERPTALPPTTGPAITVVLPADALPLPDVPPTTAPPPVVEIPVAPPAPPPTAPPTTKARPTNPAPASSGTGGATAAELEFLACTRRIESTNNYRAVDPSGTYFGAYQFEQRTWNGVVQRMGRADLVGVRPSAAAPADQDAAALKLFRERGSQPWGGRCA